MSTKKIQIIGSLGNKVYTQPEEPVDAPDGSLWVDLDNEGMSSGGLSVSTSRLLIEILRAAVYTSEQAENIDALAVQLGIITGDLEKTLVSISATYSGGSVVVGTEVDNLTGIVVKAEYSDGSSEVVTDYTLSGVIEEGDNTITVSYGELTTTFIVVGTVEETPEVVTYSITNNLTNVSSNSAVKSVTENDAYSAILTASDGYELSAVTVTMGGTDVTSGVYSDGTISIGAVTGNVVISASATEIPEAAAVNLFDKDTMVITGSFVGTNGSVNTSSSAAYAKIPIEAGKTYSVSMKVGLWNNGGSGNKLIVDADGNNLSVIVCGNNAKNGDYHYPTTVTATNGVTVGLDTTGCGLMFVAPDNAAEFWMTTCYGGTDCEETLMFEEGDTVHAYAAFVS